VRNPKKQGGMMYLAMLFFVAISAIALAGQGSWWSLERQRDKEQELLFVGDQFRQAIASYYESSPGPVKRYPAGFDELTRDQRFLPARQHLRRIYADPVTEKHTWGQVLAPDGGVMGVYSLSHALPLKRIGFAERDADFAGKSRYAEWVFLYQGEQTRYAPPRMLPAELSR
jgi:type II secretory pathway pseudopilin PulG